MTVTEKRLPDRLNLTDRIELPCGCIRAVDRVSGVAVVERQCGR